MHEQFSYQTKAACLWTLETHIGMMKTTLTQPVTQEVEQRQPVFTFYVELAKPRALVEYSVLVLRN